MMAAGRARLRAPRRCAHEEMVAAVVGAGAVDHLVLATEAACGRRPGARGEDPAPGTGPLCSRRRRRSGAGGPGRGRGAARAGRVVRGQPARAALIARSSPCTVAAVLLCVLAV